MKYKSKKRTTNIISLVLCSLLVFGAVFGAVSLIMNYKDDMKTIHLSFTRGALDNTGKYLKTNASIYTKDAFECKGLTVTLDFDSDITYQIFYYDEFGLFVSASEIYDKSVKANLPENATHARIMVIPVWDNNVFAEDRTISAFGVIKYSRQLKISVLKDQSDVNIVESFDLFTSRHRTYNATMAAAPETNANYKTTVDAYLLENVNKFDVVLPEGGSVSYIFYDELGNSLMDDESVLEAIGISITETLVVPTDAAYVHFNFYVDSIVNVADYQIFVR